MSTAALRARYLGDSVRTASPAQLLVMLYDRLAVDLERAEDELAAGRAVEAREQLQHAQAILIELRASLDTGTWAGAAGLASLYSWLLGELLTASVGAGDQRARVTSCREVVDPLRDAWREAAAATGQAA